MFTSFLRRRGRAVLVAGAAAAAVLALAAPAGASTGARQISPEGAGYTADHAKFKEVDATVWLSDPTQFAGRVARYGHSIQLWSYGVVVSLNFTASTSGGKYTPSATIYNGSTHQVIASDPNAKHMGYADESWTPGVGRPWGPGDYVWLYMHYSPVTGHLEMQAVDEPYGGMTIQWSYDFLVVPSFTKARIGTEFGSSPWDASYSYTPPAKPLKLATYSDVSLTSSNGHTADLSSVWWVRHKLLAQPPGRGQVATSHDLTNGGANFQTWFAPKGAQGSS